MLDSNPLEEQKRAVELYVYLTAKLLVDLPDEVAVSSRPDGNGTLISLRVAPTDLGKVIGKEGRTARAFRIILQAAGMKSKHNFTLDIERAPAE